MVDLGKSSLKFIVLVTLEMHPDELVTVSVITAVLAEPASKVTGLSVRFMVPPPSRDMRQSQA